MWNLKRNDTNELTYKTGRLSQTENKLMVSRRAEWGEGIVREFEMDMYALLYLKWIINKNLMYSSGNSA